jgi:GR25 family glycosyltransferase involved in LPS biosynthesis
MENIDAILYINLNHHEDKKAHILKELKKICRDPSKIHRIEAVYKPENNDLGFLMSHIKAIKYIMEHPEWNNCLIVEDDFTFNTYSSYEINEPIKSFFRDFPSFDICLLSHNIMTLRYSHTNNENIKKVFCSEISSSYILNKGFLEKLLVNYKDAVLNMITNGKNPENSIGAYWAKLQPSSNWFTIFPSLGY